jgi:tRNA acetyltransferase TAN1
MASNKRNKKRYYKQQFQAQKRSEELMTSMAGFMVTCDRNKEKRCINELMNVLTYTTQELYPILDEATLSPPTKKIKLFEDYIKEEIDAVRNTKYYFVYQTNCSGILFLKLNPSMKDKVDVTKVGMSIIDKIHNTQEAQTKFTYRLLPIVMACKAKIDMFKAYSEPYINNLLASNKSFTWCMEIKVRNNNSIKKEDFFSFLTNKIGESHTVDLYNPDITVLIEVINDLLCFSLLDMYNSLCKYNLQGLSSSAKEKCEPTENNGKRLISIAMPPYTISKEDDDVKLI